MNYSKLMSLNPFKYGEIINNQKQLIEFYETPMFIDGNIVYGYQLM